MVRDIDKKLRLTAVLLGTPARKDLAAAFRRVNPNTTFDVTRADKWLQGRARPRELRVYEDWSKVLGLDRPGQWISDCDLEDFLVEACARHGREPEDVWRQLDSFGSRSVRERPSLSLAGTYVCYSHAWSPYFRGRLVRGELSVADSGRSDRVSASYAEILPTGRMQLDGWIAVYERALRVEVCDATRSSQFVSFALFPPSPPVSVLGGLMFGTTLIGPDSQPSVSRAVLIRLPAVSTHLLSEKAYLPADVSISEDLATLGLLVEEHAAVDRCLATFLGGGGRDGIDQVPASDYRALVDRFDRIWLMRGARDKQHARTDVRPFPGRAVRAGR